MQELGRLHGPELALVQWRASHARRRSPDGAHLSVIPVACRDIISVAMHGALGQLTASVADKHREAELSTTTADWGCPDQRKTTTGTTASASRKTSGGSSWKRRAPLTS